MKKLLTALGAAAVIATMTMPVSAEKLWKYSETVTIDLAEARYKPTTDGHDILEFVAVEQLPDGTCTYTYVYDRTAGTIQVKEMEKTTKKLHYKSNFSATYVNSTNPVIRERAQMAEAVYQKKVHKK